MRLITDKKKWKIGKRLSAIYYIAVHGYGRGVESDLKSTEKILEHIYDIAYAIGGERFANIDIPAYVMRTGERKGGASDE